MLLLLVCSPSSGVGLEQPRNDTDAPALELEKVVDVMPTTMKVVELLEQAKIHVPHPLEPKMPT
jgi:hypothetical protein